MRLRYGVCREEDIVDDRPTVKARTSKAKPQPPVLFTGKTPKQWFRQWNWRGYKHGPDCRSPEVQEYLHYVWHELTASPHVDGQCPDWPNMPPYALK